MGEVILTGCCRCLPVIRIAPVSHRGAGRRLTASDCNGARAMDLNDLLRHAKIDPQQVLVFRHRPAQPELNKVLPWLAAEKPDVFNAYQRTQSKQLERVMAAMAGGYVASFIRHGPGKALFVGLYTIGSSRPLNRRQFWRISEHVELKALGMRGFTEEVQRDSVLFFDLVLRDIFAPWKGKLIVEWPPPERSWWRRAHKNTIPVVAILEDSALDAAMPEWDKIVLTWEELRVLPMRWRSALSQWRGIYYIFDVSDAKAYVGSAYGQENLLGRWLNYAASGDGGNCLLRPRNPQDFRFSILQRVSPDMEPCDVIRIESSWKERLHTLDPFGLNEN